MSATLQQQVSAATKSQIEGQLAAWTALNNTLLDGVTRLADLNMRAARDTMEKSAAWSRDLIDTGNPQDFLAKAAEQVQPNIERLTAYGRQVADIANDVRLGVGKVVQEEITDANRQMTAAIPDLFKQAPGDAGPLGEWMKTALDAANAGYAQWAGTVANMSKTFEEDMAVAAAKPNGRAKAK